MSQPSALINVMTAAAQKAGRKMVRDFSEIEHLQVSKKGPGDFVSNADKKAEKIIFQELQRARPKFSFLMEETGEVAGEDSSNRWVIDPIDGTTNFLHGIPHFAISIGLERDGECFAGVIYDPINDQMFWAEKGQGAYLNRRRLRVSGRRDVTESLFSTGIPFIGADEKDNAVFMRQLTAVASRSAGVRRFGAASLDLAWVAAGRYEGFWEAGLCPWDMAAGIIMVREAGGYVTDQQGSKNMMNSGEIVAANDSLHAELLALLRKARKASS